MFAIAVPFLRLMGVVAGGWQMARAAKATQSRLQEKTGDAEFYRAKISTARFYADHILPQALALALTVENGAESVLTLDENQF